MTLKQFAVSRGLEPSPIWYHGSAVEKVDDADFERKNIAGILLCWWQLNQVAHSR